MHAYAAEEAASGADSLTTSAEPVELSIVLLVQRSRHYGAFCGQNCAAPSLSKHCLVMWYNSYFTDWLVQQ